MNDQSPAKLQKPLNWNRLATLPVANKGPMAAILHWNEADYTPVLVDAAANKKDYSTRWRKKASRGEGRRLKSAGPSEPQQW